MKLPDWAQNIIITVAVPLFVKVVDGAIPEDDFRETCRDIGEKASKALRSALGNAGESVESLVQKYANIAIDEFNAGADKDDDVG